MKFYSEKTKKIYDTEDELNEAEQALQAAKDNRDMTRKQLAKKIEDAQVRVTAAENKYAEVEKEVAELIEKTKITIKEMYEEPIKELRDAQNEKFSAIREFNNKFGTYTVSYSGKEAERDFDRLFNSFTGFGTLYNLFKPWIF